MRAAMEFFFQKPSISRIAKCAVLSITACTVVIMARWLYMSCDQYPLSAIEEAWTLSRHTSIFMLSWLGVAAFAISLAIKWGRSGWPAMNEHLTKHCLESLIPAFSALMLLVAFNLFYTVRRRIEHDANDITKPRVITAVLPPPGFAYNQSPHSVQPETDHRIQFTVSPLWTLERKARVRSQINDYDKYLTRYGVIKPPEILPLWSITEGTQTSFAFSTPVNPPFDGRQIPVGTRGMTPFGIRLTYGLYVFDMILGARVDPHKFVLDQESWIYSVYFAASSVDAPPPSASLKSWNAVLWDVRKELGREFTDRVLMYSLKAPVPYNDDLNKNLRERLWAGEWVVHNEADEIVKVNKILERYSLLH